MSESHPDPHHFGPQFHPPAPPAVPVVASVPVTGPDAGPDAGPVVATAQPTTDSNEPSGARGAVHSGERRVGVPVGRQARWKTLYAHLETLGPGELFTWEEMGHLLELDFIDQRSLMATPFKRAADELMRVHRRAVVSVRGIGWKIATPADQLKQAHRHQKRALVEVHRGRQQVEAVDPDKLDPETRKAFTLVGSMFRQQAAVMEQLDVRQKRLETVVAAVQDGQQRTEQAVALTQDTVQNLMRRLAALEQQQQPPHPTP